MTNNTVKRYNSDMAAAVQVIQSAAAAEKLLKPERLRILELLTEPDSASGIARRLSLPRQTVNYHLRELEKEGFVEFVDVEKSYDGRAFAVMRLNLSVARGEFLTLLGPSGSGKTTTLNMLAGFERPTRGSITLDGHSVDRLPPAGEVDPPRRFHDLVRS